MKATRQTVQLLAGLIVGFTALLSFSTPAVAGCPPGWHLAPPGMGNPGYCIPDVNEKEAMRCDGPCDHCIAGGGAEPGEAIPPCKDCLPGRACYLCGKKLSCLESLPAQRAPTPGNALKERLSVKLPQGPTARGDDMQPGETLGPHQKLKSANGRYTLQYQGDGNLVLYDRGRPLWASNTAGKPVGVCIMQGDGNLVIYIRDGVQVKPIWASNTAQHPGSRLIVQNDGNVVIYRPDGKPVWATNTVQQ